MRLPPPHPAATTGDGGHASQGAAVDAVVVGAGPNGLAAAAELVRSGLSVHVIESHDEIGGGTRSAEVTVPGLLHDLCSAVHPLGAASPCFTGLDLQARGLRWVPAEVDVAHPLALARFGL